MKKIALTLSLLLTMVFSVSGASAQLGAGDGGETEDIEGLTSGYSRTYSDGDFKTITVFAYQFESDDMADDYLVQLRAEMEDELEAEDDAFDQAEVNDLQAVDDDGFEATVSSEEDGVALKALAFADDNILFVVMVVDSDIESATSMATEVADHILEAEVETDEISFEREGTSTGGGFDRMPKDGDKALGGLEIIGDTDMME